MPTLPVYRRGEVVAQTLVDDEDWERWRSHRFAFWSQAGYAATYVNGRKAYLHRLILDLVPGDGMVVDHINRDRLDNRRCNLRLVTTQVNLLNRGGAMFRDEQTVAQAIKLHGEGASVRQIAAALDCPKSTVHDWIRAAA